MNDVTQRVNVAEMERISQIVAMKMNVTLEQMRMPDGEKGARKPGIVRARQMAMAFCRKTYGASQTLKVIGWYFGKRDHSTVLFAIGSANNDYDSNDKYRAIFEDVKYEILRKNDRLETATHTWETFKEVRNQL